MDTWSHYMGIITTWPSGAYVKCGVDDASVVALVGTLPVCGAIVVL